MVVNLSNGLMIKKRLYTFATSFFDLILRKLSAFLFLFCRIFMKLYFLFPP
ncbi:hypothetical protein l13_14460 [Neisseria weaveri ATCC 51223]|nr:hypothetical protein l13_14460 [Neisseria weaveri ATCC 51223]